MIKSFITTVSILTMAGAAFAGESVDVVSNYDPVTRMIVLEGGEAFRLTDGVELEGLKPGEKVVITFDDGTTDATSVAVVD